ncbi:MAG: low specificity L-threonine aldolase, partial [Parvularculaceae bacterium]|nr:low specificity L-threonine aldolase [Parvularculaceae bacterium]
DNWAGAHPTVMDAVVRCNDGFAPSYGGEAWTKRVEEKFSALFERDVAVYFVATGGAANALALSVLTPPYGMILAHEESHIQMDECGAPEFFTGGAKILPLKGKAAKLAPETVTRALRGFPHRPPHGSPIRVLSLTQATECGAVYSVDEVSSLARVAKAEGLSVHVDGARFANALAALKTSAADATWRAGVDALSFGGTKNGCIGAEAVVFFDRAAASDFEFRRKRGGHLLSKSRYVAAQFEAYLADDLWLRLADHANRMARRLSDCLAGIKGCRVWYETEANEVFVSFSEGVADRLRAEGARFYPWITPGDPAAGAMQRLICAWSTTTEDVDQFLAVVEREAKRSGAF